MDYLVGFWLALTFMSVLVWYITNHRVDTVERNNKLIRYSQSHVHSLVSPLIPPDLTKKKQPKTQSRKHEDSTNIRVIIMDSKAYWIKDNVFYSADMAPDGTVDKDTTQKVDTFSLNKVQLDKMVFIVDRLTEGLDDDSRYSGN